MERHTHNYLNQRTHTPLPHIYTQARREGKACTLRNNQRYATEEGKGRGERHDYAQVKRFYRHTHIYTYTLHAYIGTCVHRPLREQQDDRRQKVRSGQKPTIGSDGTRVTDKGTRKEK